ncbi:MAG: hypothetical protein JXC33_13345 [Deltaproteobacteria bacterium]|nr:hypothetical protein [Deltaproteobacteria bacterium]
MNEKQQEESYQEDLTSFWMKSAGVFLNTMFQMWSSASESLQPGVFKAPPQKSWQVSPKMWQPFISALTTQESMDALVKGITLLPEFILKTLQSGWEGYSHLQKEWMEKAARIGKRTEAFKYEDIDQDLFKAWSEVYEKEFRQFLRIPQIGLTRFYQERMAQATDHLSIFEIYLSEFMNLLYLPIEKSANAMSKRLEEITEKGELSENFEEYYNIWIKLLEGHYMTLFKSPEYLQSLNNVVTAGENYYLARNRVIEDILQFFPVATHREMDELYKEIYLLKKNVKELSKKVADNEK